MWHRQSMIHLRSDRLPFSTAGGEHESRSRYDELTSRERSPLRAPLPRYTPRDWWDNDVGEQIPALVAIALGALLAFSASSPWIVVSNVNTDSWSNLPDNGPDLMVGGGGFAHVAIVLGFAFAIFGMIGLHLHDFVSLTRSALCLVGIVVVTIWGAFACGGSATHICDAVHQLSGPQTWNIAASSGVVATLVLSVVSGVYLLVVAALKNA